MYGRLVHNLEMGEETQLGVEDNICTLSVDTSNLVAHHSDMRVSKLVRSILTNTVQGPPEDEMQKA